MTTRSLGDLRDEMREVARGERVTPHVPQPYATPGGIDALDARAWAGGPEGGRKQALFLAAAMGWPVPASDSTARADLVRFMDPASADHDALFASDMVLMRADWTPAADGTISTELSRTTGVVQPGGASTPR